jgi:MscS family membrane protein
LVGRKKLHAHFLWMYDVIVVALAATLFIFLLKISNKWLMPRLEKTHKIWDDAFVYSIHKPLIFLVALLAITYALQIVDNAYTTFDISVIVHSTQRIGIVLFFLWFAFRFTHKLAERLVHPEYTSPPMDRSTVEMVAKIFYTLLIALAIIMTLQTFGVRISGVLAFGGAGAIVVGLAGKDILANFFGGMMIYLDRPFLIGDWIRSPDKDIEGTVEKIGWRLTRIRTFDKRPLYVPNSIFSTVAIENPSRMTNRRIQTKFGVRYCDANKIEAMVNDIEAMLKEHPEIDQRQTMFVKLAEFAESSLNILVYTFTKTTQWVKFQEIQQDVFLKIIDIVYNKHKASMAFPTRTLEASSPLAVDVKLMKDNHEE